MVLRVQQGGPLTLLTIEYSSGTGYEGAQSSAELDLVGLRREGGRGHYEFYLSSGSRGGRPRRAPPPIGAEPTVFAMQ